MPIYMNYTGIEGSVTAEDHKAWIEVDSFQWGIGRGISGGTGSGANRESGRPSVSEIVITKTLDAASPKLSQELIKTTKGVDVKIDFVRTGDGKAEAYLKIVLTNTLIAGYSLSSGGERPTESVSLNFTKFEYNYTGMKADGKPDSPFSYNYDVALAK